MFKALLDIDMDYFHVTLIWKLVQSSPNAEGTALTQPLPRVCGQHSVEVLVECVDRVAMLMKILLSWGGSQ